MTLTWPGYGVVTEDKFRELRRSVWRCYGPEYATIDLLPEEVAKIRAYLRLVLGAPSKRGRRIGIEWADAGIVLCEDRPQVRWISGSGKRSDYQHIMLAVYDLVEGNKS